MTSEFVGVDGCRCGWVSVGFSASGEYELKAFFTFEELVEYYHAAKLILVDMPIGLPEGAEERPSDPEAKAHLGPRKQTVFRAPTRQAMTYLACNPGDREGAKAVQQRITRKLLTNQTLELMPKINAVDRVMLSPQRSTNPEIREVHPEICFWALNGRRPMKFRKKDAEGIEGRLRVLEPERVEQRAREILEAGRVKFPGKGINKVVADDDILDALAAAVTARRGAQSDQLQALPEKKERQTDGDGLSMEMVFWEPQPQTPPTPNPSAR